MPLSTNQLSVGATHHAVFVDDLTCTQKIQYAGASGDYNLLHTDGIYATQVAGYPSVFVHGTLTMGMTGRMLTDYVGDGRLIRFGGRFTSQVWPGDTLTARATVTALGEYEESPNAEFDVVTHNQNDVRRSPEQPLRDSARCAIGTKVLTKNS
jgi:acyl dehydratase